MKQTENYRTPTDRFVQSLDVHTLIPQTEPFMMVSRLEHFEMQRVVSSLEITKDNYFFFGDVFETTGLLENIAQTCALRIGYINKYILGREIQIGVLGGIDNLTIYSKPNIGDTIRTEMLVNVEFGGYLMVHAEVTLHEKEIMSADIKIAIKE